MYFWSLHAALPKKILHLVSYKMLNFRLVFNLNLFLGSCMPALLMKILHFATRKYLISGLILALMQVYDLGVCMALWVRKFYN